MGKAGRLACIITPIALTVGSIICLVLLAIGGTNKGMSVANDLWFMKLDTRNFDPIPDKSVFEGTKIDDDIIGKLFKDLNVMDDLKPFYTVSLWNYCSGTFSDKNESRVEDCGKPKAQFYFDPIKVWGLDDGPAKDAVPKALRDGINIYRVITKWMFIVYIAAFVATVLELIVGFFAILSRWGSFVTTIISGVSALFTLIAAGMATGIYATVTGVFNGALKPYGIKASLGRSMYSVTWMAVAFSCGAALFWLFSVCCCSGRNNDSRKGRVEKTPYTYEQVSGPFGSRGVSRPGGSNVPMQDMGATSNAYEPYRHNAV